MHETGRAEHAQRDRSTLAAEVLEIAVEIERRHERFNRLPAIGIVEHDFPVGDVVLHRMDVALQQQPDPLAGHADLDAGSAGKRIRRPTGQGQAGPWGSSPDRAAAGRP